MKALWICLIGALTLLTSAHDEDHDDNEDVFNTLNDTITASKQWEAGEYDYLGSENLKDWGDSNYSWPARYSVVRLGDKVYDPVSFKGGENNSFAVAFHLSTEVAVSAAQSRNATLFDVAKVDGDESYNALMAQMQQDLKGNRSLHHSYPDLNCGRNMGIFVYPAYLQRLYRFWRCSPAPPPVTNPSPIFRNILSSLLDATEESLGMKLNTSSSFYGGGKIYLPISAPWELNHTFSLHMRQAMGSLGLSIEIGDYSLFPRPSVSWTTHWNDEQDYTGPNATELPFQHAKDEAEMREYSYEGRYGTCGTRRVAEWTREVEKMKKNGLGLSR